MTIETGNQGETSPPDYLSGLSHCAILRRYAELAGYRAKEQFSYFDPREETAIREYLIACETQATPQPQVNQLAGALACEQVVGIS